MFYPLKSVGRFAQITLFLGPAADHDHLVGNVALGNHFLDINDENSNCGSDTYVSDVFGTADESCVK